jgi:hypothetical protein
MSNKSKHVEQIATVRILQQTVAIQNKILATQYEIIAVKDEIIAVKDEIIAVGSKLSKIISVQSKRRDKQNAAENEVEDDDNTLDGNGNITVHLREEHLTQNRIIRGVRDEANLRGTRVLWMNALVNKFCSLREKDDELGKQNHRLTAKCAALKERLRLFRSMNPMSLK